MQGIWEGTEKTTNKKLNRWRGKESFLREMQKEVEASMERDPSGAKVQCWSAYWEGRRLLANCVEFYWMCWVLQT